MEHLIYRFDNFQLNPLTRELKRNEQPVELSASAFDCLVYLVEHRERPIGRDELISAIWGRVDISDNRLAQAIVRLRRALGDTGSEQRCVKTVARIGYRWIAGTIAIPAVQVTSASVVIELPTCANGAAGNADHAITLPRPRSRKRLLAAALLVSVVLLVTAYATWRMAQSKQGHEPPRFNQDAVAVLPADVTAPEDWRWLRFGLMELVSNRLREAKIPTETSQAILVLLKQRAASGQPSSLPGFRMQVQLHVVLQDEEWHVRLDAKKRDGESWMVTASSTDVLQAARSASDLLLAQWGYGGLGKAKRAAPQFLDVMQHVDAARLAGQPDVARKLIEDAPPSFRNIPEVAYTLASLDCDEGKNTLCKQQLLELLSHMPEGHASRTRGEILTTLGLIYGGEGQHLKARLTLDQAVDSLQAEKGTVELANAYLNRAYEEQTLWKLDDAASDLGRARVTYALSGDTLGAVKVDFEMGLLDTRRNQPATALQLLETAYAKFQSMGMRSMLPVTLDGIANVQKMLLKFDGEWRTTNRFWPFTTHDAGFLGVPAQRELTLVRAIALADHGRTVEASTLAEKLVAQADPLADAYLIAETHRLLAELSWLCGDYGRAASMGSLVLKSNFATTDPDDFAQAWFIYIDSLLREGHLSEAAAQVDAMSQWVANLSTPSVWADIYFRRARAARSWATGNRVEALEQLKLALATAEKLGVPEAIVGVGAPYTQALLATGHLNQAMAIGGQISAWATVDWRAARAEACLYRALGQNVASEQAGERAKHLAGDRPLPATGNHLAL